MRRAGWLVTLALLAACTGDPPPTTAPAPEVTFSFSQHRVDENSPRANLRVVNLDPERPLEVTAIGLDWPGYGAGFTEPHRSTIPVGLTTDLRLTLPEPECGSPDVTEVPAVGVVETLGGGRARGPLAPAGQDFLEALWSRACNAAAVADVADVEVGDRWRVVGAARDAGYVGTIDLVRTGSPGTGLEVRGLEGSILFELTAGRPRELPPGQEVLRIPVRLTPFRCDPHARGETTQAFLFRLDVSVDGGPTRRITVTGDDPGWQADAMDYLDDACG